MFLRLLLIDVHLCRVSSYVLMWSSFYRQAGAQVRLNVSMFASLHVCKRVSVHGCMHACMYRRRVCLCVMYVCLSVWLFVCMYVI